MNTEEIKKELERPYGHTAPYVVKKILLLLNSKIDKLENLIL